MRKFIIGSCVVMAVLVGAIIWALQPLPEKEEDVFDRIGQAPCAKFEYCESEDPIFVTSEIRQLSTSFLSLTLESSDIPVSDWIYKVTFYNSETFSGEMRKSSFWSGRIPCLSTGRFTVRPKRSRMRAF